MKIYVGNLSFKATEDDVRDFFAQHGEVSEVAIISDRETGRSRGFAFVTMPDDAQGQAAIGATNGQDFMGRPLVVNEARPKTERPGGGGGYGGGGGGRRGGGGWSGGGGRRGEM